MGTGVTACYKPIGERCSPRTSSVHMFPVGSPWVKLRAQERQVVSAHRLLL